MICDYHISEFDLFNLIDKIQNYPSKSILFLVRGLPGSGKSFLGKFLANKLNGLHFESDRQFTSAGEYQFNPMLIQAAHENTQNEVDLAMSQNIEFITVTNTFTMNWEFEPYIQSAMKRQYTVFIFDLYQYVLKHLQIPLEPHPQVSNSNVSAYLDYLNKNNEHEVPQDKIIIMSDRYMFSSEVLLMISPTAEDENAFKTKYISTFDTGYYLGLNISVCQELDRNHSAIYWACIFACNELLRLFGVSFSSQMIKKLTNRNLKSHSSEHVKVKLIKINSGWTRYHITILSPTEYDLLKESNQLENFRNKLDSIELDDLNTQFNFLENLQYETNLLVREEKINQLMSYVGVVHGPITDPSVKIQYNTEISQLLPSLESTSYAFYIFLDKTIGTLRQTAILREEFNLKNDNWNPHITFAFTHNDIHTSEITDPSIQINPISQSDRFQGLSTFQDLRKIASASVGDLSAKGNSTTLQEVAPYPQLAELLLHSEVNIKITTAFNFAVCDLKIRKGAFGDDASYRSHPILHQILPRGLVYLQYLPTNTIYYGLFSLKKFYGKEGMEDDGFGMTSNELNYKLNHILSQSDYMVIMEKVNGRAGSARFFQFLNEYYLIIGTKLAHSIVKLDIKNKELIVIDEYLSQYQEIIQSQNQQRNIESFIVSEEINQEDQDDSLQYSNSKLILINTFAFQKSINWDCIHELIDWIGPKTMNGEILDPEEMHLVTIDNLQWVFLCSSDFSRIDISNEKNEVNNNVSLVNTLQQIANYFSYLPTYTVYHFPSEFTKRLSQTSGDTELEYRTFKHDFTMEAIRQCIFERNSEGKVLYLLDPKGQSLEMMKYKTWWYIYRRSIREITAKLFTRYKQRNDNDEKMKANKQFIDRLTLRLTQMEKAKNKENDLKFQEKLNELRQELAKYSQNTLGNIKDNKYLQSFCEEIKLEISRKWPAKFQFLKDELQEVYLDKIKSAMTFATLFIEFIEQLIYEKGENVMKVFRAMFPLIWNEFLLQHQIDSDV